MKEDMEEDQKRTGNVRSPLEVELQPEPRDRKANRNSWAKIYTEMTVLRKSNMLLGREVEIGDSLEWRVKWGQRGMGMSGLVALICFVAGQLIATAVFGTLSLIFAGILYYKNVSLVIAKRLVREPYVVMILVLALCNWSIDIARPANLLAPLNGFFYLILGSTFVFVDAVNVKSRMFMIVY